MKLTWGTRVIVGLVCAVLGLGVLVGCDEESSISARERKPGSATTASSGEVVDVVDFTYELPAYWQGRVETNIATGNGSALNGVITLPGNSDALLATISLYENGELPPSGGDIGSHMVSYIARDGKRIEVWARNWPWIVASQHELGTSVEGVSEEELRKLVDLSTGGKLSYDEAIAAGPEDEEVRQAEYQYINDSLVPTVNFK